MDILEVLQTVGICVGALALAAIAVMLFFVLISFVPTPPSDDPVEGLRGKTPEEIGEILRTPVYPSAARHKRTTKKAKPNKSEP